MFEYLSKFQNIRQSTNQKDKVSWKQKIEQSMQCGLALSAHNQENILYVDSGCSKHIIGDKRKKIH